MEVVIDNTKIKGLGYNSNSIQDDSIIEDGVHFHKKGTFLILSNKAIPKNSQVYMEIVVTSQPNNMDIRYLPLMLGVHKEPSFGIINADCCLGSIYYTKMRYYSNTDPNTYLAFRVIDKIYNGAIESRYTNDISARVPIRGSIIGLGVNMLENSISIFVDGRLLYDFNPLYFNMNQDEGEFYFAVYCPEPGETTAGIVDFGRYGTKYIPNGYTNFYAHLYSRKINYYDLDGHIIVGKSIENTVDKDIIKGSCIIENDLAPIINHRRDLELVLNKPDTMTYYVDLDETMINKHAFKFSPNNEEWAYINLPLDKYQRLYFEFHCSNATLINNYLGIPISIGLTKDKEDLSQASFKIDLFHLNIGGYKITTKSEGFEYIEGNYKIVSPSTPVQPNTIGIIIDLFTSTIEIYTEGILFTSITSTLIDFSKDTEPVWLFFEPNSSVFKGTGHIVCNFGTQNTTDLSYVDDVFKFDFLRDNSTVLDLWYYYNHTIKEPYYNEELGRDCSFDCSIKVISDKLIYSKIIYSTITVLEPENEWGFGLNKLWKSYNKVSKNNTSNNLPDKNIFDIQKMIEEDKVNNRR